MTYEEFIIQIMLLGYVIYQKPTIRWEKWSHNCLPRVTTDLIDKASPVCIAGVGWCDSYDATLRLILGGQYDGPN